MSIKIVQEGLTMSASSFNSSTQSFIEGGVGGGYMGCFFYLHNSRESIILATSKFNDMEHVGVQSPKWDQN